MKKVVYLSVFCVLALAACTGTFKKGDDGLEYKIISDGKGKTLGYGNFMQIHITQVYGGTKDSILMDTRDFMSRIQVFDSVSTPLAYFKIMSQLKKGDSLIIRILTDTLFKDAKLEMPPFMKHGKYLYTHLKLLNFFETPQEADSANKAESIIARPRIFKKQLEEVEKNIAGRKPQMEIDSKIIDSFLAKNNIKADKTKWGTYITVIKEGTGDKINHNHIAFVDYTGRTLDSSKVFDSSVDPEFQHVQPYPVNMTQVGGVILGWTDALLQLRAGSKVTVYIPSSLGYGLNGKGAHIKPNDNLIFDLEVKEVITEEAYAARQKALEDQMQDAQKKYTDSIRIASGK